MKYQKQILIVEDNELEREMLRGVLAKDYEILEAENGQVAFELLEHNWDIIDLIVLDIQMPVMDGYTFLNIVKQNPNMSSIPVIVMTQHESEENEIVALEHGATDFVAKPYHPQILLHRIENLIRLSETAAMERQLRFDELTGLYSKQFYYQLVKERLEEDKETQYVIVCSNMENFKLYNDTFGRKAGDYLLIQFAEILKNRIGDNGICCRYSADRFFCLLDQETEKSCRDRFIRDCEERQAYLIENMSVKLGIYEITNRSISVEQMCDRALLAADSIKGLYNQNYAVYNDELRERLLREKEITDVMEDALEEEQFDIYFQPKYSLYDNCMIGAEALVRWTHPDLGFLSPGEFIPLFEKNGFIHNLDLYVWEKTCQKLHEWKEKGYPLVSISVNVSRADFYKADLVEIFCNLIDTYQIDIRLLHLEITENAYTTDSSDQIIDTVERLRELGFIIEMDDFGSGDSSLNMFSQMAVDILKLDMTFIRNELAKPMEQSILSDVINMAHRMHLNVVAEGVETNSQMISLKRVGCDYAQGYYYAKPMKASEFEKLLIMYKDMMGRMEEGRLKEASRLKEVCGAKRMVLVVENDELSREMLTEILSERYIVLAAKDGKEGLEILKKSAQSIAVILLDLEMPMMNGYEFLKEVSGDPVLCKIPVVITTARGNIEEEERCLELGATDFIVKPYNSSLIQMRVDGLVQRKEYDGIISELETDALTGFKNRKAYYEDIVTIELDPEQSKQPIGVIFADINGLKEINDSEGHEAGDRLILKIAKSIREIFTDARIYRLGGDEFVILSFEEDKDNFSQKMMALKHCWKAGQSAAIGSVWLEQAKDLERYVALADQEMYRDKNQYYEKKNHELRKHENYMSKELFWKMDEISEFLPGGFFIYKADESEEIVSMNNELLKLYGCETREEFKALTGNSFRGMVHPDDLETVENDISSQIKKENDIDYVEYRIVCKDGRVKQVRDYGRFVHTELFGDVYYVFVNDITKK